jgi:hypothetical protein
MVKKKTLNIIKHFYVAGLFAIFLIYYYRVQEDGQIDIGKHKYDLLLFGFLFLIGAILAAVDIASLKEKGSNISKKAVYAGVSLGVFFIFWRLAVYFV